jgi:hypothetical protein
VFVTGLNERSRAVLRQMKALDLPNVRDVQRYEQAIDQAATLVAASAP